MEVTVQDIVNILSKEGVDVEITINDNSISLKYLCFVHNSLPNSIVYFTENDIDKLNLSNCTLVCNKGIAKKNSKINYIEVDDPKISFYILAQLFKTDYYHSGIHKSAIIHSSATIGKNVYIGPNCVIEANCIINENVEIHANTMIYQNTIIEENVIIESNSSIGASGLFWTWDTNDKMWQLPFRGGVKIMANCFLGTDVTIVRGCFDNDITTIGANTKIAHGTKVGHDCLIKNSCHIANNVSLGGKVILEDRCFLGSGVTIKPGCKLSQDTIVGTGSVVTKDYLGTQQTLIGVPARLMERNPNKKPTGMHAPNYQVKRERS